MSGEKTLLALSGGIDSMVMNHLFYGAGFDIGIAHCNFLLRGEESEEDEIFLDEKALSQQTPFYTKRFKTKEYAEVRKLSTQMAARELRYQWFDDLMKTEGFDNLAVAHHKDDQLETVIFNLAKGTGIAGLTGMPSKSGTIIRPLLFADRQMINDYAIENKLEWHEDSSNESLKYKRNLIRHKIVPVIKEINPGISDNLEYTLQRLTEAKAAVSDRLKQFLVAGIRKSGTDLFISKEALATSPIPTISLHHVAGPLGYSYRQCSRVVEILDEVGKIFYAGNHVLNIDREDIIISEMAPQEMEQWQLSVKAEDRMVAPPPPFGKLIVKIDGKANFKKIANANIASLDLDKLKFPLILRPWKQGDYFIPIGMKGKKKVSDLMIDEKIPLNLKSRVMVLESGGKVAWVVGIRIDDRFKITSKTTNIWKAEYEEN